MEYESTFEKSAKQMLVEDSNNFNVVVLGNMLNDISDGKKCEIIGKNCILKYSSDSLYLVMSKIKYPLVIDSKEKCDDYIIDLTNEHTGSIKWNVELTSEDVVGDDPIVSISVSNGRNTIRFDDGSVFTLNRFREILKAIENNKPYCRDFSGNNSSSLIRFVPLGDPKQSDKAGLTFSTTASGSGGDMTVSVDLSINEGHTILLTIVVLYEDKIQVRSPHRKEDEIKVRSSPKEIKKV